MNKRLLVGLAAAGIVGGATFGFAASLNGVASDNLGADDSVVASCDSDGVAVSYTTAASTTTGVYQVTDVVVSGIDGACDGQDIKVTLTGSSAAVEGTSVVNTPDDDDGTDSIELDSAVDAESVTGFHIVISG